MRRWVTRLNIFLLCDRLATLVTLEHHDSLLRWLLPLFFYGTMKYFSILKGNVELIMDWTWCNSTTGLDTIYQRNTYFRWFLLLLLEKVLKEVGIWFIIIDVCFHPCRSIFLLLGFWRGWLCANRLTKEGFLLWFLLQFLLQFLLEFLFLLNESTVLGWNHWNSGFI